MLWEGEMKSRKMDGAVGWTYGMSASSVCFLLSLFSFPSS